MTPDGAIHRKQLWAQIRNGQPELLETPEQEPPGIEGETSN